MTDSSISRSYCVGPITALASAEINKYDSSCTQVSIYSNSGGHVVCVSIDGSDRKSLNRASIEVFSYHCVHGIKVTDFDSKKVSLLVWGDKSIAILVHDIHPSRDQHELASTHAIEFAASMNGPKNDQMLENDREMGQNNIIIINRLNCLDDFILDCHLEGQNKLFVGHAHNFVDILAISSNDGHYETLGRYQCPFISVLFSMTMNMTHKYTIASGTVFGDIIFWSLDDEVKADSSDPITLSKSSANRMTYMQDRIKIHCKVKMHEGVVFRMKWSDDKKRLVSVSDDRTVRLWDVSDISHVQQIYVGWGHISRLWDAAFLYNDNYDLVTSSEDGTLKLWNESGKSIATMRGHEGSIWRIISVCGGKYVISAGNDSSIKTWDIAKHTILSSEEDTVGVNLDIPDPEINNDYDISMESGVSNKAAISRRSNGVSNVFSNPSSDSVVVVLADGPVWHIDLRACYTEFKDGSVNYKWTLLYHSKYMITSADCKFTSPNVILALAHPDGTVSVVTIPHPNRDPKFIDGLIASNMDNDYIHFVAHDVRAVNLWLLCQSSDMLSTASVNGCCRVWRRSYRESTGELNRDAYRLMYDLRTGRNDIASSCYLTPFTPSAGINRIVSQAYEPMTVSPSDSHDDISNYNYLFVGDSRGNMSAFILNISKSFELKMNDQFYPLYPLSYHPKLHSSDPITDIVLNTETMFTVGLDGFLNTYLFIDHSQEFQQYLRNGAASSLSIDSNPVTVSDHIMRSLYQDRSLIGVVLPRLEKHIYQSNPIKLISRHSTLPIKSPDGIHIMTSLSIGAIESIYISGYQSSQYILWDVKKKYELMRVEGGGWKRPHHCSIDSIDSSKIPRVIFTCPVPSKKKTYMNIVDSNMAYSDDNSGCHQDTRCTNNMRLNSQKIDLPIHLGTNSEGRVNYAGCLLHIPSIHHHDPNQGDIDPSAIILVGGESGNILLYCNNIGASEGFLPSPIQQLDMPMNTSIKSMKITRDGTNPAIGIYLATGGKLRYSIWSFDTSNQLSGNVFHKQCDGTLWPQATQDHRTLAVDIISVKTKPSDDSSRYSLLLCDSRGMLTVAKYIQRQYNPNALPTTDNSNLTIYEQFNPFEYPVLCCKILNVDFGGDSSINIGIIGDTTGGVHIFLLAGSHLAYR